MSKKHSRERQTGSLCLSFFSPPPNQPSHPIQKWVVSSQVTKAAETARRAARFYVQCDCACK
jgi:hypothetical protein